MTTGGDSSKPDFLAFASNAKDIAVLKEFAAAHNWSDNVVFQGDIRTGADFLRSNGSPTLLLVEIPSAEEAPALLDVLADVCDPETKVIITGDVNEYSFYCWLTDIGVFSYLLKPLTLPMLESAYAKSVEPPPSAGKVEKQPAKVIAVLGTRGGVGATTVTLNLAGIIAASTKKSVALVDIDPQEGSISLQLDIEPSRGLRDALEKPDRIDALFIERVMTKPLKNLSVLSAEESLQERLSVHDHAADTLLRELRAKFDVVILDIPRYLNPFSRQCIKQADHILLVTELSLLCLRDALRLGDLLRDVLKLKPPVLVAQRVGSAAKYEMQPGEFEKGINGKIAYRIPFAPDVFMQIGNEIPAVKFRGNPATKQLFALAESLVPEAKGKVEVKETKSFSLFKKGKKEE